MKSVEEELKEIEAGWELNYLDVTHNNYRHRVEFKKEEVIVRLSIPERYPEVLPEFEFGGKIMKEIDEKMQQSTLRIVQQNLSASIGKPMIGSILENIWKHIKSATMENNTKISENSPAPAVISRGRRKKKKTKYTIACSFGVVGSNHAFQNLPVVKTKSTIKKSLNDSTNSKESQTSQKVKTEPKARDKAPPMKTARDAINRSKQQQQQNEDKVTLEFSVVKVIPDNSQQTNLEIAEEKESSIVDIGSAEMSRKEILETAIEAPQVTACEKTDENLVEETAGSKQQQQQNEDKVTQKFSDVKVIPDNSQQTNLEIAEEQEKDSSLVDIGSAEMSRKEILETAIEAPKVTACEKTDENPVEETAGSKQQQQQNEDKVTQEFSVVTLIPDNSQQTNLEITEEQEKESSLVDIGSAEVSMKEMLETAIEAPQVTACEKTDENPVEETAGLEEPSQDKTEKTEEDMASPAIGDASQVEDELQIGVTEDVDEGLNVLPFQLESIDINANDFSPREVGKQRHDRGHSKYSRGSGDGHPYHRRYDHHDRGGRHNRGRSRYDRGGGGRRRGGSGSHWDYRDQLQYQYQKPNFSIGIELDDSSNEKLSHAISSVVDTKDIQIRWTEHCRGSMSDLYISSLSDASKLAMALESACQRWGPINTAVDKIDVGYVDGYVTISLHSKTLQDLHRNISRIIERDRNSYHFCYFPHMRIGTTPDARQGKLHLEGKIDLKIISLKLSPLEEPNFDFRALQIVKFQLQGVHEQDEHNFERKGYWNDSHGRDQDKRFRMEKDRDWETNISKRLSAVLRHGAMGLHVDQEGFIEVKTLLAHQFFRNKRVEEDDIARIVANNGKKRFTLEGNPGNYKIRANQGHTVQVENLQLKEITNPEDYPKVVHGTSLEFWDLIKKRGLSKMRRNHIHMTTSEPRSDQKVISGMRNSSNCFVYIDLAKAMKDGIKFFLSDNGVILSEGVDGVLDRKYFSHATGIRNRKRVDLPIEWEVPSKERLHEKSSTEPSEDRSEKKDPSTSCGK